MTATARKPATQTSARRYALERAARHEKARLLEQERRASERREAAALELRLAETVALARARGEQVERPAPRARVRVISRDGLQSAFEAGHLTARQYQEGLAFRAAYELRSADIGSPINTLGQGAAPAHDNDRYVVRRLERARSLDRLGRVERAVALQCVSDPAALNMLRWVAGEGLCLRSFGAGRAWGRHVRALRAALDVAAGVGR